MPFWKKGKLISKNKVDNMDDVISICNNCGFSLGIFIPGMECPECGEILFP